MTTHSEPSVNVILLLSSSHSRIWSLIVGGMMGVWKRTRKSKNNENNGLRPNVSFFVWKRMYTFCTGLAYCPQVSDENCHRKRILSKTLSRETIFENRFCSTCVDTEVFENDYITVLDISMRKLPSKMVLMVQSLLLWVLRYFPCGQAKTIKKTQRVDAHFKLFFLKKRRRKISILRQKRKRVDGPLIPLKNCYQDCKEIIIVITNDLGARGQKV